MASRLHRLLRIIRMVRKPRYPSVLDLCHALDVKQRTIFNDLKELKELLGVDIRFDRSRNGYFLAAGDESQLSFWGLDEETAVLLAAACRMVSAVGGDGFAQPLNDMFSDEIRLCLSEHWECDGTVAEVIDVDLAASFVSRDCFLALCRASVCKQPVSITLKDSQTIAGTPSGLVYRLSGWQFEMEDGKTFHLNEVEDCVLIPSTTFLPQCSDDDADRRN